MTTKHLLSPYGALEMKDKGKVSGCYRVDAGGG